MTRLRTGRQRYYNLFSHFYDGFIRLHASNDRDETRQFIVDSAALEDQKRPKILDVCCGTGSVVLAFAQRFPDRVAVGYDFSIGMLDRAKAKDSSETVCFIKGDAARLAFADDCFDIVCCSHALYELKGQDRKKALAEMKRVVKPDGTVLIMEHEVPRNRFVKMLFTIRMLMMGPTDAREFLNQGLSPYKAIFTAVALSHTQSGKSKLIVCRKS